MHWVQIGNMYRYVESTATRLAVYAEVLDYAPLERVVATIRIPTYVRCEFTDLGTAVEWVETTVYVLGGDNENN